MLAVRIARITQAPTHRGKPSESLLRPHSRSLHAHVFAPSTSSGLPHLLACTSRRQLLKHRSRSFTCSSAKRDDEVASMASDFAVPAQAAPLSFMQSLSPTVAYFDPGHRSQPSAAPELILFLWMGARDEYIAKYMVQYRALFPTSRILLIRCPVSRVWLPWVTRRDIIPALPIVQGLAEKGGGSSSSEKRVASQQPRVLVQMFSNGGISTAVHMLRMLKARPNGGIQSLPRYVLLLDSCPGYFHWRKTHRALLQSLPWWTSPFIHLAIAISRVYHGLQGLPAAQNQNARLIRAPQLLSRECRQTYLYSTGDDVIDYREVEDNARKAEDEGFEVRKARFEGASHVAIIKAEPERYWRVVRASWDGEALAEHDDVRCKPPTSKTTS